MNLQERKKRPKKGANPTLTDENGQFHGELRADISIGTELDDSPCERPRSMER